MDKISYALGMNVAESLLQSGVADLNVDSFAKGLRSLLEGADLEVSKEEAGQILNAYFTELQSAQTEQAQAAGNEFLAENAKKDGVVTLESGLQYKVISEGNGAKPAATDQVKCHYHGTLIDGTVFDSSVQRNQPATFPVNGVIKGWVEALQLMAVGSKWQLFIPSDLGYGAQGAGGSIPPHTTLIFEVELLEIV